jgi:hypothetical protein
LYLVPNLFCVKRVQSEKNDIFKCDYVADQNCGKRKMYFTTFLLYFNDPYGPLQILQYFLICPEASWVQILRGTSLKYVMRRKIQFLNQFTDISLDQTYTL